MSKSFYAFQSDRVSFRSFEAMRSRLIYAPLCGPDGTSLKSSITPYLSGDIRLDKNHYVTKPTSREDLRSPVRNVFLRLSSGETVSLHDAASAQDGSYVEVGQLWHKVVRVFPILGIEVEALSFVPATGENVELTKIIIRNTSQEKIKMTPFMAVALFGRALENKHDHEHVTALLHRVQQISEGVVVEPTMLFHEEGHKSGDMVYSVLACDENGQSALGTYPVFEDFFGEGDDLTRPQVVQENRFPRVLNQAERQGKEVVGAFRFQDIDLAPGGFSEFVLAVGAAVTPGQILEDFQKFSSSDLFDKALEKNKNFWDQKTSAVTVSGKDQDFSSWMRWVTLQPVLRRIYGCSFLPDHDYGKGGKGWRDIWQDLLSLILIEPEEVRCDLLNNFAGVRIDGTNATIIGQKPGEFVADRNAISRVWMDHGAWPFLTALLYIDQSGDMDFLFEKVTYFSDPQLARATQKNEAWTVGYGQKLKDKKGKIYQGTVLEHILVQHLVAFFNVGEHNIFKLEGADWNDGLDMARDRGESVAFMSLYAGNLNKLADLLERVQSKKGIQEISLAKEMGSLLGGSEVSADYDDAKAKTAFLYDIYFPQVQPELSGEGKVFVIDDVVQDLRAKASWAFTHIRRQEQVSVKSEGQTFSWFNGYYDNDGQSVEGQKGDHVRMTLTGQVFPLMAGVVNKEETANVVVAVDHFLNDKELGSVRLNTNFGVPRYLSFGRAFGFAFGTKENGAVFSHMTVMYAYALYQQGLAREGHKVLQSLYKMSSHPTRAKIYPGIPEYFDAMGRGMYHFLTGSASWYVLAILVQAYGIKGDAGDLVLAPQLVKEEFDDNDEARAHCTFAGKKLNVVYVNKDRKDAGEYCVSEAQLAGQVVKADVYQNKGLVVARDTVLAWPGVVELKVILA